MVDLHALGFRSFDVSPSVLRCGAYDLRAERITRDGKVLAVRGSALDHDAIDAEARRMAAELDAMERRRG